jgi:hypothetical protein
MGQSYADIEATESEADTGNDKAHRVRQRQAARHDRHQNGNGQQAQRVSDDEIHDPLYGC